jgi:hypothetical protein
MITLGRKTAAFLYGKFNTFGIVVGDFNNCFKTKSDPQINDLRIAVNIDGFNLVVALIADFGNVLSFTIQNIFILTIEIKGFFFGIENRNLYNFFRDTR